MVDFALRSEMKTEVMQNQLLFFLFFYNSKHVGVVNVLL